MEIKTITTQTAIRLLSKTIANNNDDNTYRIAKEWIDLFNTLNEVLSFTFNQPDDENRLWYLLESQKEHIIRQLPIHQPVIEEYENTFEQNSGESVNNEHAEMNDAVTITEPAPEPAPAIQPAPIAQAASSIPQQAPAAPLSAPTPAPVVSATSEIPFFFTTSQELAAAAFHDRLCSSLEKAFQSTHLQSSMHFEAITTRLTEIESDIKQELAAIEYRITAKLAAIFKTTCISANNTEAISTMFNTHSTVSTHKPEFTD